MEEQKVPPGTPSYQGAPSPYSEAETQLPLGDERRLPLAKTVTPLSAGQLSSLKTPNSHMGSSHPCVLKESWLTRQETNSHE